MDSNPCFKLFGITILPVNEEKNKPQIKVFGFSIFPEKDYPPKTLENIPKNEPDLGASSGDEMSRILSKRLFIPTPPLVSKEDAEPDLSSQFRRDLGASSSDEVSRVLSKRLFIPTPPLIISKEEAEPDLSPQFRSDLGASSSDEVSRRVHRKRLFTPTPLILKEEGEPDLSPEFRRDLGASPGDKVSLIFRKRLYTSDINSGLARLSLPNEQILTPFLNEEEERFLQQRDEKGKPLKYTVDVIDPCHRLRKLKLVRWNYDNSGPKSEQSSKKRKRSDPSWSYILNGKWREFVESSGLKEGNQIQVWSFRRADGMLRFAIVNLDKESAQARVSDWGKRRKRGSRRSIAA